MREIRVPRFLLANAAFYLANHGIDVILIEANADCSLDLRAST